EEVALGRAADGADEAALAVEPRRDLALEVAAVRGVGMDRAREQQREARRARGVEREVESLFFADAAGAEDEIVFFRAERIRRHVDAVRDHVEGRAARLGA